MSGPAKPPGYRPTPRPYRRGQARPLILCPKCECYMPAEHDCKPA